MKRNDWIIIIILLLCAGGFYIFSQFLSKDGNEIVITVDGEVFGKYSLSEDQTIQIGEHNIVEISNGYADMIHADCPNQLCVKQKKIAKTGEAIICLPNQVIVTVTGDEQNEMDAIVN